MILCIQLQSRFFNKSAALLNAWRTSQSSETPTSVLWHFVSLCDFCFIKTLQSVHWCTQQLILLLSVKYLIVTAIIKLPSGNSYAKSYLEMQHFDATFWRDSIYPSRAIQTPQRVHVLWIVNNKWNKRNRLRNSQCNALLDGQILK